VRQVLQPLEGGGTMSGSIPSAVEGFAAGGQVPGTAPHARADNVLARLTPGEYVLPVAAVRQYGLGFMEQIRALRYPAFADGGLVGDIGTAGRGLPAGVTEHVITIGGRRIGPIFAGQDRLTELVGELQRQLAG
jgi:hypothetical protein